MATEGQVQGGDEEPTFRERLIALRTMELPLRVLTLAMIAQIGAGVVLLCLRHLPLWPIDFSIGDTTVEIGGINYILAYASVIAALTLGIVGLMGAELRGALAFFAILAAIYIIGIVGFFSDPGDKLLVVFTIFMWTALAALFPKSYRMAYSPERRYMGVVWGLMAFAVGIPALIFLFAVPAFTEALILFRIPLVYLFVLAGTDWAEIDDGVIRFAARRTRVADNQRLLFRLTAGLAAAIAVAALVMAGPAILNRAVPLAACAVVLLAVLRLARFPAAWPIELPWAPLALLVVGFNLIVEVAIANGMTVQTSVSVVVGALTVAFAAGLVYAARNPRYAGLCSTLLFGLVLGLVDLGSVLPIPLFAGDESAPVVSLFFYIAVATLAVLAWLAARRGAAPGTREILVLLLVLNGGLVVLYLLWALMYELIRGVAETSDLIAGLVVFAALTWDILLSGRTITNVQGTFFPRRSRVYLFFAFVALAVATIVFWGSLHLAPGEPAGDFLELAKGYTDTERLVELGIGSLGPPLLLTFFIVRLGRRWPHLIGADSRIVS
jgi:hypothetical protein